MSQYLFGAGFLFITPPPEEGKTIATPVMLGTMQECSVEFSGSIKELFGSNQFAEAVACGTQKITGKAKFANINANVYNQIYFNEKTVAGGIFSALQEEVTASAKSTFTPSKITADNGWYDDLGLISQETGKPLKRAQTATVIKSRALKDGTVENYTETLGTINEGEYGIDRATGLYTLHTGAANKKFYVSYLYQSKGTSKVGNIVEIHNKPMGAANAFRAIFNGQFNDKQLTLILNACMSSKLGLIGTKNEDFSVPDFAFSAMVDDFGKVGTLSTME